MEKAINILSSVQKRGPLTYILGARCADGIVLVGDRRITRGAGSIDYEDKIFSDVHNVVIGASGVVGLFDKFRRQIQEVASSKPSIGAADFIKEAERIVYSLNTEYFERTHGSIDLLVAYGKIKRGQLQYVTRTGLAEEVRRYQVVGSGTPYGTYLLRMLWKENLTMEQVAILGALIVKHIEDNELDEAVGVGKTSPQIWFVPDWPPEMTDEKYKSLQGSEKTVLDVREISQAELAEIQKKVDEEYAKIGGSLHDIRL